MSRYHLAEVADDEEEEEEGEGRPCLGVKPKSSPWRSLKLLGGRLGNSPEPSHIEKQNQRVHHATDVNSKARSASSDSGVRTDSLASTCSSPGNKNSPGNKKDSLWTSWRNSFKKKSNSSSSSSSCAYSDDSCLNDSTVSDPFLASEVVSPKTSVQSPSRPAAARSSVEIVPAKLSITSPPDLPKKTLLQLSSQPGPPLMNPSPSQAIRIPTKNKTPSDSENKKKWRSSPHQIIDLSDSVKKLESAKIKDVKVPLIQPPPSFAQSPQVSFRPIDNVESTAQVKDTTMKLNDQTDSQPLLQPKPIYKTDANVPMVIQKEKSIKDEAFSPSHMEAKSSENEMTFSCLDQLVPPETPPIERSTVSPAGPNEGQESRAHLLQQGIFPEATKGKKTPVVNLSNPFSTPTNTMGREIACKANIRRCNELLGLLGQLKKTIAYDSQDESEQLLDEEVMKLTSRPADAMDTLLGN